ncbi:unnamed protein product [Gemmataceae bacterium]|nr:unnamed protein product [Gemmataceae bacterium]VTU02699.1 unnamed protein product [Gemmataceae bacterium]
MTARRTGAASVAALLAVAFVTLGTDALLGIDAASDDVRRHEAEAAHFEAQRVRMIRESEASGRVAARVAAGDLTLVGAVDELEPVLRERPGFDCAWLEDPPPTFRHRVARCVLVRVAAELENEPGRRAVVLARLDADYAALP